MRTIRGPDVEEIVLELDGQPEHNASDTKGGFSLWKMITGATRMRSPDESAVATGADEPADSADDAGSDPAAPSDDDPDGKTKDDGQQEGGHAAPARMK
jgi:hypothetical protein